MQREGAGRRRRGEWLRGRGFCLMGLLFLPHAAPGSSLINMGKLQGALKRKDNLSAILGFILQSCCLTLYPSSFCRLKRRYGACTEGNGFRYGLTVIVQNSRRGEETAAFMYPPFCPGLTSSPCKKFKMRPRPGLVLPPDPRHLLMFAFFASCGAPLFPLPSAMMRERLCVEADEE